MKTITFMVLVSLVFVFSGCATMNTGVSQTGGVPHGSQTEWAVFKEMIQEHKANTKTFDVPYEECWLATLQVIKTMENPIVATDKEAGTIVTDYLERPLGMFSKPWRDKYYFTLSKVSDSQMQVSIKRTVEEKEAIQAVHSAVGQTWRETVGTEWTKKQSDGAYENYILDLIEKGIQNNKSQ